MSGPERDSTISVKVNHLPLKVMVDNGAAFTCIRPEDATHIPMSGKLIWTIGSEGVKWLVPSTKPIELKRLQYLYWFQNTFPLRSWEEMLYVD